MAKDSRDYTGKSGAGKRYLDEYGNFRPITELPSQVQNEIKENSRRIQAETTKRRLANQAGIDPQLISKASDGSSDTLLKIIEQQSNLINRLEAKIDGINAPEHVKETVEENTEPVEVQAVDMDMEYDPEPVEEDEPVSEPKLTPKEELMWRAQKLGIEVNSKMTMKVLQKLIDNHIDASVEEDDEDDL